MVDAGTFGAPNWVDLSTPDIKASVSFYREVMGWSLNKQTTPMGDYYVADADGHETCGLMESPAEIAGAQAMWSVFFHVENVETTVEAVTAAGGVVVEPPFDIPGGARVCVATDPTGSMFALISGGPSPEGGTWISQRVGGVCWVELLSRDVPAAVTFYGSVFGWDTSVQVTGDTTYTTFQLGGEDVAGLMNMPDMVPAEAPSHWNIYFTVDDCAAVEQQVVDLGGETLLPTTDMELGRFAVAADPQGAVFNLMEYARVDSEPIN